MQARSMPSLPSQVQVVAGASSVNSGLILAARDLREIYLYDVMKAWIFKIHVSNKFILKLMLEIMVMIVVSIQLSTTR